MNKQMRCPMCGGSDFEVTTMGRLILTHPDDGYDRCNTATCGSCRWSGKAVAAEMAAEAYRRADASVPTMPPMFTRLIVWKDGGPVYLTRDGLPAVVTQWNKEMAGRYNGVEFFQGHIDGVPHEWLPNGSDRSGDHSCDIVAAKLELPKEP